MGGLNAYSYCQQDPINYQDPSENFRIGRFFSSLHRRIAGGGQDQAPKKQIFQSIHDNVTPVVVAPALLNPPRKGVGKVYAPDENR